jgi:uncharacterized protein (DUF608 family)
MNERLPEPSGCDSPSCGCGPRPNRREAIGVLGLAGLAAMARPAAAMAGPFAADDFAGLVPADKRLAPAWRASLTARGAPEVWRGDELRFLGMPVGGIGCGQLYLAGDGRLWFWDIFRPQPKPDAQNNRFAGTHYEFPPDALDATAAGPLERSPIGEAPVVHGFALRVAQGGSTTVRTLDRRGFAEVAFRGEYPIGKVSYRDPAVPLTVELEAFSPFVPLDLASSSLPATVLAYTVTNSGSTPLTVDLAGWLEHAVLRDGDGGRSLAREVAITPGVNRVTVSCAAVERPAQAERRPDVTVEDWSKPGYEGWTVAGTAFGSGPITKAQAINYQGDLGGPGGRLVNSHATAPGRDVATRDAATGTLTGRPFRIERHALRFPIGGGSHAGKTCLNVLIDGKVVRSATGRNDNRMAPVALDVREFEGREATIQIVDAATGAWGNVGVGPIVQTDGPTAERAEDVPGFGSIALSVLGDPAGSRAAANLDAAGLAPAEVFARLAAAPREPASETIPLGPRRAGAVGRSLTLEPGASGTVTFLLSWSFPHHGPAASEMGAIGDYARLRRHYAARFAGADAVAAHVAGEFERLAGLTRLWNRTWYDSTLPFWLLDRAFVTIDCLATQTLHGFDNGRWWGWEGVDCCAGTCQHVWQYGQAAARVQPEVERALREITDFGLAWREDGAMDYRSENAREVAHDGFCGTIVRAYREHAMSADDGFLRRIWPRVRRSVEYILAQDRDADGLLEGVQYNTLDAAWAGPMGWISSLFLAALAAGRAMAEEMGDAALARTLAERIERGRRSLVERVYDGEYFIHLPPDFRRTNTNKGCHIDQVFGQSLAWAVGLPRVVPQAECRSALKALWRYNFAPDVGPYRAGTPIRGGRWYAMPGEAGLLMCTWPKGGAEQAPGNGNATFVGYFNECMNGFEYQVASHMVWEALRPDGTLDGELREAGLAIARAVHDRYAASRRNPFNEIECSDHYARSMASYAVFLAACGFQYHGPKGHLSFAPRLNPDDFRAPFTAAEGWGTLLQRRERGGQMNAIALRHGRLRLRTMAVDLAAGAAPGRVEVTLRGAAIPSRSRLEGHRLTVEFADEAVLAAGDRLEVRVGV